MQEAIRSQRVVLSEGVRPASVVFESGRVIAVEDAAADLGSVPVYEAGEDCVLPGLIDTHIHINAPGRSEWEGFETAGLAAAAGGYTCLVDMPLNCIPATTNVAALEQKRSAAAGNCAVDFAFWGGAVKGNEFDISPLAHSGVKGFKSFLVHPGIEEFSMVEEEDLRRALPYIARAGLPLLVHAEDPAVIASADPDGNANGCEYRTYLASRPDEAEVRSIELLIALSREYSCHLHVVHLSSAAALPALRRAREEGLPITVETCPHYLYFAAEAIPARATYFKCAPPIRSKANRELLWEALREGTIDLIATDHSPCPPEMKLSEEGNFLRAWGGIASISIALPAIWTAAQSRGFSLPDVVRWMSHNTATLAGINSKKGRIAPGYDADFVVFDPAQSFVVQSSDLHFRHAVSPYLGEHLTGRVKATFLRGRHVFRDGVFAPECRGNECTVGEWTTAS